MRYGDVSQNDLPKSNGEGGKAVAQRTQVPPAVGTSLRLRRRPSCRSPPGARMVDIQDARRGLTHWQNQFKNVTAGTRTRVAWVKATYPNRLDYGDRRDVKVANCSQYLPIMCYDNPPPQPTPARHTDGWATQPKELGPNHWKDIEWGIAKLRGMTTKSEAFPHHHPLSDPPCRPRPLIYALSAQ
jgi:hypothetical protein